MKMTFLVHPYFHPLRKRHAIKVDTLQDAQGKLRDYKRKNNLGPSDIGSAVIFDAGRNIAAITPGGKMLVASQLGGNLLGLPPAQNSEKETSSKEVPSCS